jgi:predicted cation transporter
LTTWAFKIEVTPFIHINQFISFIFGLLVVCGLVIGGQVAVIYYLVRLLIASKVALECFGAITLGPALLGVAWFILIAPFVTIASIGRWLFERKTSGIPHSA